jgi:hypothetical protein
MKYLPAIVEKDSVSSSDISSTTKDAVKLSRVDYDRLTDKRRILLLNVPDDIDYDYLELYLEYLSDEIEIECIDYAREMQNSIVATFVRNIGNKRNTHHYPQKLVKY